MADRSNVSLMREEKLLENVPAYEFINVNSNEFHIGTFRDLWLDVLNPEVYSYCNSAPEIEDVEFIEEMGMKRWALSPRHWRNSKSSAGNNRGISIYFSCIYFMT